MRTSWSSTSQHGGGPAAAELHCAHGYDAAMAEWSTDPDLLRTFLAVHRHRNLTRAAEELFVTQPAVSRRLARLERALGVSLIERLGKALHPTEAGNALAAEAAALIGSMERLAETVRARRSGQRGSVRIGASTTPGLYHLPPVLVRYRERHPEVEVSYCVENSVSIEEKLIRNDLDLGFVGGALHRSGLRSQKVLQDEVVCYAAASHPLAGHQVTPDELRREICVVREAGSATRGLLERRLQRARVRLGATVEIGCPEAAKVLVRARVGFSYISRSGLRGELGAGLQQLEVAGLPLARPIYLAWHAGKQWSPALRAFLELAATMLGSPATRIAGATALAAA
jgi:DNA-binding transcriptional LysR family regulator